MVASKKKIAAQWHNTDLRLFPNKTFSYFLTVEKDILDAIFHIIKSREISYANSVFNKPE